MERPLRIEYPEAWHHVMNRARKGYLFIKLLKEITQVWNARL